MKIGHFLESHYVEPCRTLCRMIILSTHVLDLTGDKNVFDSSNCYAARIAMEAQLQDLLQALTVEGQDSAVAHRRQEGQPRHVLLSSVSNYCPLLYP